MGTGLGGLGAPRRGGGAEYWGWFGLPRNPFEAALDPELMYWGPRHKRALTDLLAHVEQRSGIAALPATPERARPLS